MKLKKEKALAGVDVVIAVVAITIFSTLIISLISNNVIENVKLKKDSLAMIYITEIFENIGIESYSNLENGDYEDIGNSDYNTNIENLIPQEALDIYKVDLVITDQLEDLENNENIIKKIVVTLTYNVNNKNYTYSMERMKIKE